MAPGSRKTWGEGNLAALKAAVAPDVELVVARWLENLPSEKDLAVAREELKRPEVVAELEKLKTSG